MSIFMKNFLFMVLFVSLITFGKETITKTMITSNYNIIELVSKPISHTNLSSTNQVNCTQCHGCKNDADFSLENNSLELMQTYDVNGDTIRSKRKEVELKQIKS